MKQEEIIKKRLERCMLLESKGYTYDQITGKIYGVRKKEIGRVDWAGYISISHNHPKFGLAGHHFAFYMINRHVNYTQLDHINGVRNDNRIDNLRVATSQENSFNRRNVIGYTWNKVKKKWCSKIKVSGITHNLNCHDNQHDARQDYLKAKQKLHKI
jgi:hypothetical protein